jgi:PAS domain S-box-containing protein
MTPAPFPPNESTRLAALMGFDILDTPAESEFDDITRLAARICEAPIAFISLIDLGRQWLKSRVGIEGAEMPREIAFCSHTILGQDVMEVQDAAADPRFADNPLVAGPAAIRFYAGMPLTTAFGSCMGALAVADRVPRALNALQRDALRTLGRQVVRQMELRTASRRFAHESAFHQAILHSAAESIISTNPEGIITSFSRGSEKLLGYSAAELVGQTTPALIHDPAEVAEHAARLTEELGRPVEPGFEAFVAKARGGGSETREWTYIRRDRSRVPVLLSVSEVADENGKVLGFIGVARDITELKRAQADLERLAAELKRSNKDLEHFASIASHDLQEPLRMVTSYLDLLQRRYRGRLDAQADEFIAFAVDGAKRMKTLILDLLAYSRLGTRKKAREPVAVSRPIELAIENLKLMIGEKQAVISVGPMPEICGDPVLLTQLFQNLVGNALKFAGKETPRIQISARRQAGEWIFSVADNGIGMEPENLERIFEIFHRLHSREEYPGTGIGLALCKRIVEIHGGRIWAESERGKGSVFSFSLPADGGKD